jgi:hypothetical protein
MENMTRKGKTGITGSEWRRIFAAAAKECAAESKRTGIRYQDCIKQKLAKNK